MNIAFTQVGQPIRPGWINFARSLSWSGESVFFLGPSPAFELLLKREGFDSEIRPFDIEGRSRIPECDRREDIIDYNTNHLGRTRISLENRCQNYKTLFEELNIDVAVFWNDIDVGHLVAKNSGVKTVYLENGYLPDSLQIDTEGVNKNARFADYSFTEVLNEKPLWEPEKVPQCSVDAVPQLSTPSRVRALIRTVSDTQNYRWIIRNEFEIKSARFKRSLVSQDRVDLPDEYIFVPFQVHDDTQILYNSPYVDNMRQFLKIVSNSSATVASELDIVVKEHPVDVGRISYSDLQDKYPDVTWLRKYPIEDVIENSSAVVTINSSVGMRALKAYKPVVTLGESFYDNNPFVEHPTEPGAVPDAIDRAIKKPLDESMIDEYLQAFQERLFVSGGIGNIRPSTVQEVCSAILSVGNQSSSS